MRFKVRLYYRFSFNDQPNFNPMIKTTSRNSPAASKISPGTRIHLKKCMISVCINSAERAYQYPSLIEATDCIIPIGRRLIVTITNNPILVSQKAQPINLSFHWRSGYRPLRTNIINPIPKIPYTPNRAAWP